MEASSAVNQPHPGSSPDEADLFFGGEEGQAPNAPSEPEDKSGGWPDLTPEQAAQKAAEYRESRGEPEPLHEEVATQAPPQQEAPAIIGDPEPSEPAQGDEAQPEPQVNGSGSAPQGGEKKSGPLEREYVVFHTIALTKRVLEHMLKQVEEGAEARIAHFEIHRVRTRNVNHAVGAAYSKHRQALGEGQAVLHAVSSKSFQKRTVEPRPVQVEAGLTIR